jgi:acyl-coenzyme A thioesterase PaaI-like protein
VAHNARVVEVARKLPEAFYLRESESVFVPTPATVGPWDPGLQHGSPPAALLAHAMIAAGARDDMRIAHFSLDFLGPVPAAPMTVRAEVVRPGKRIQLITATASVSGRPVLRASAWLIAVAPDRSPALRVDDPAPPLPSVAADTLFKTVPHFGYGDAVEWRFVAGSFQALGPATVWSRPRIPLLAGETTTPFLRALLLVDSANGISAELDFSAYTFVPVNLTVAFTRAPDGEWIGMSASTALAGDGAGTASARLFDAAGFFAEAHQPLFVGLR